MTSLGLDQFPHQYGFLRYSQIDIREFLGNSIADLVNSIGSESSIGRRRPESRTSICLVGLDFWSRGDDGFQETL